MNPTTIAAQTLTTGEPHLRSTSENQYGRRSEEALKHQSILDGFLRYVRLNRTQDTANCWQGKLRPLLRAWDALPPEQWTKLRFEEYLAAAKAGTVPGQRLPLGPRSVQLLLQATKLFGEWCRSHDIACPEFWTAVKKPRNIVKEVKCLTLDQAKRLIEVAHGTRLELGLALAAGCGMRKGDAERALWEDWRETEGTILVRREKTHLHHRVPVPAFVQEILKRRKDGQTGLIVGKMHNLRRSIGNLAKLAGVPRTHYHGLRHTWTSELLARGASPSVVQRLGGWSSLSVLARYSHALGNSMKEAARLLE